jgi:hypothetical protein
MVGDGEAARQSVAQTVVRVELSGSTSRGTNIPGNSDLDFLVTLEPGMTRDVTMEDFKASCIDIATQLKDRPKFIALETVGGRNLLLREQSHSIGIKGGVDDIDLVFLTAVESEEGGQVKVAWFDKDGRKQMPSAVLLYKKAFEDTGARFGREELCLLVRMLKLWNYSWMRGEEKATTEEKKKPFKSFHLESMVRAFVDSGKLLLTEPVERGEFACTLSLTVCAQLVLIVSAGVCLLCLRSRNSRVLDAQHSPQAEGEGHH